MFRRDGEPVIRIHPEEARVVQRIFRWFLSGWTLTEICQHLTEQGIPTKKGHTVWAPFYVKYILTNERYTGEVLAGARPSTIVHLRPDTRDREPIRIPDSHPPIVDKASFRRAGELLNARKRTSPSRTRRRYPLERTAGLWPLWQKFPSVQAAGTSPFLALCRKEPAGGRL